NREIHRIGERDRGTAPTLRALATGAVRGGQRTEFHDVIWRGRDRVGARPTRRRAPGAQPKGQHRTESRRDGKTSKVLHDCVPPRGAIVPGASTPARSASETFSSVGIGECRTTTVPATIPKATCDAMNQNQSM